MAEKYRECLYFTDAFMMMLVKAEEKLCINFLLALAIFSFHSLLLSLFFAAVNGNGARREIRKRKYTAAAAAERGNHRHPACLGE
jgi:hypothetical protein